MWEYNGVKERHPDDMVLYQMGDFFEIYGEDAKEAAPELGLQLVSRAIPGGGRVGNVRVSCEPDGGSTWNSSGPSMM